MEVLALLCISLVDIAQKRMLLTQLFSTGTRLYISGIFVSSVNYIDPSSISSFQASVLFPLVSWFFMHLRWSAVMGDVMQFVVDQELYRLPLRMLEI